MDAFIEAPFNASHSPKLTLTIAGGALAFTRFCPAIIRPDVAELAQAATTMAAPGAAALAHSASRIASLSSEFTPGSEQLLSPLAGAGCTVLSDPEAYCERPNVFRKVSQSCVLNKSESSMTTTVSPVPVIPLANKGLKTQIVARS